MYELSLEKAEEPEIKLPAFIGSQRKQRNSRKTSTSASLTTLKPLTVWITANCGKFLKTMEDLLLKNFPEFVVIHIVKGFGVVNKTEVDVFLELSCFFDDPADVGNLISGSSAFSKTSLDIWKFTVHILLKPGLENFEHYFASMWDECNCVVVWTSFGIAFLWDWNENWPFPVLWPLVSFPNLLAYWVKHFHNIIF